MKADSEKAIELNPQYFKAFLRNGEACIELGKMSHVQDLLMIDKGIKQLQKSIFLVWKLDQSSTHFPNRDLIQKEIERQIMLAKKIRWFKQKEIELNENELILDQLVLALGIDPRSEKQSINTNRALDLEKQFEISSRSNNSFDGLDQQDKLELYAKVKDRLEESKVDVKNMMVPDYLVCRITDELMVEPVVLQSGFTYEKQQIQLHFKQNGNFDPLTREEVDPDILIPNKNIKHAIQEFLAANPWAFEYIPGHTLEHMKM